MHTLRNFFEWCFEVQQNFVDLFHVELVGELGEKACEELVAANLHLADLTGRLRSVALVLAFHFVVHLLKYVADCSGSDRRVLLA